MSKRSALNRLQLEPKKYFLVSAHREENVDVPKNLEKLSGVLNGLASRFQIPVIVSTHPRTKKRESESDLRFNKLVKMLKPLGFHDYNKLQNCAKVVLSDSGSMSEESSISNFPALNIREAHERPEAFEEAIVMMVGLEQDRVVQGINILELQGRGSVRTLLPVQDYTYPNVSKKVVRIIMSYTDYVSRVVWRRD